MPDILSSLLILVLLATSLTLLVGRDWRWGITAIGVQYLAAFLLVNQSWPLELAVVKLVTGWMAVSVLGFTRLGQEDENQPASNPRITFKLLASGLILLIVLGAAPNLAAWIVPISLSQAWGGFILIGMGLMVIAMSRSVMRTIFGLLTLFSGFEVLYAAVEASTLVAGLLAALNLGLALVGVYALLAPSMEPLE